MKNRDTENIAGCPVSPEDPNQAQLQLENPGDIDSISPDISQQQTLKTVLKIIVPVIPVIPAISYILLLLLPSIV